MRRLFGAEDAVIGSIQGPGALNESAVIGSPDDIHTMVRHALIRYRYRQERQ